MKRRDFIVDPQSEYARRGPLRKRLCSLASYLLLALLSVVDPETADTIAYDSLRHNFKEIEC